MLANRERRFPFPVSSWKGDAILDLEWRCVAHCVPDMADGRQVELSRCPARRLWSRRARDRIPVGSAGPTEAPELSQTEQEPKDQPDVP
jgi:hypothetical protein